MNQLTGAEAIVRLWQAFGVEHIFGLCGDTSLPLYDALFRMGGDLTHVLTRDERSASYMADAYARATGNPAFVNLQGRGLRGTERRRCDLYPARRRRGQ